MTIVARKSRVGIIGIGGVGKLHLAAYALADKVDLVAVCDVSPERIRDAGVPPSVRVFTSAEDMLSQAELDIACILTPPSSHEHLTELCARHRVNVLCEKPLAATVEAARRMVAVAEQAGIQLFYGSSYRFLPAVQAARRAIRDGRLGEIRLLREQSVGGRGLDRIELLHASHYPAGGPGGFAMGLADHGIHLMDVMGWLMDATVVRSGGRGNVTGEPPLPEHLTMTFSNGAVGHLLYDEGTFPTEMPGEGFISEGAGWDADGFVEAGSWTRFPGAIHVFGTEGALRIYHYANAAILFDSSGIRRLACEGPASPHHFASQIDAFAEDLRLGREASTPARAGVAALETLMTAFG